MIAWALVTTVACGDGGSKPACAARRALQDAVRAVAQADAAEAAGDDEAVGLRVSEVDLLLKAARRNLSVSTTNSVERAMLEAAGYLQFIVDDYRASGAVDGTLVQFASRELNRAPAPGEQGLNC